MPDAVLELWRRAAEDLPAADRAAAQRELLITAEAIKRLRGSLSRSSPALTTQRAVGVGL